MNEFLKLDYSRTLRDQKAHTRTRTRTKPFLCSDKIRDQATIERFVLFSVNFNWKFKSPKITHSHNTPTHILTHLFPGTNETLDESTLKKHTLLWEEIQGKVKVLDMRLRTHISRCIKLHSICSVRDHQIWNVLCWCDDYLLLIGICR